MAQRIGVVGAGNWGTALAKLLADKGEDVVLWSHEPDVADSINRTHHNYKYLAQISLPPRLRATSELEQAIGGNDIVLSVMPSQFVRSVWKAGAPHLAPDTIVVSCSKGIEHDTQKLVSEVLAETLTNHPGDRRVFLSGPSFAREVAHNLPTTVTVAGTNHGVAQRVQQLMRTERFLTFTHHDIVGVELGGALKNVIAIATGTSDGLGYGSNARAALITRGLYEMVKIGQARGAEPHTFMGLSGIGDLVLTATDEQSRNYTVGKRLGNGEHIDDIIRSMNMVAEGHKTSIAVHTFVTAHDITAPICSTVYQMLHEALPPHTAAEQLCGIALAEELRSVQR